uniref:Uncharacterized protein n=1 Tax=Nelumbo nucifera TaxID=4432 RepID=A0A822YQA1_NELNU|nr:TPA_asm: hypothetical protein HUJ06_006995 [Nelumbo nucifera]
MASKPLLFFISLILLILLLPTTSNGAIYRTPRSAVPSSNGLNNKNNNQVQATAASLDNRIGSLKAFSFFPKGTPVPPSGPSKRHNRVINGDGDPSNDSSPMVTRPPFHNNEHHS